MDNKFNTMQVTSMMSAPLSDSLTFGLGQISSGAGAIGHTAGGNSNLNSNAVGSISGWSYWQDYYYPQVIRPSYPVYVKERAEDKGKQAFEIIKLMQDKKLMKLDTVGDFIKAMDLLIGIL